MKFKKYILNAIFDYAMFKVGWDLNKEYEEFFNDEKNEKIILDNYLIIPNIYKDIIKNKKIDLLRKIDSPEILEPLIQYPIDFKFSLSSIKEKTMIIYHQNGLDFQMVRRDLSNIKTKIFEILVKKIYEIKIDIKENENPLLEKFKDKYQVAIDLFNKEEYKKALFHARDVFQKDLEENFKMSIKSFENSKNNSIEFYFNNIIQNITDLRNKHFKIIDPNLKIKNIKTFTKLSIEQLINIRNFIEMSK